jgi:thiosulfate/3-mercaptopyruvate sulfurtransferase
MERITKSTQFFDHDEIVLHGSSLPHTLPTVEIFTKHMVELQVSPHDHIVCYDNIGMFSAPRAAWMFRYFGAENV